MYPGEFQVSGRGVGKYSGRRFPEMFLTDSEQQRQELGIFVHLPYGVLIILLAPWLCVFEVILGTCGSWGSKGGICYFGVKILCALGSEDGQLGMAVTAMQEVKEQM